MGILKGWVLMRGFLRSSQTLHDPKYAKLLLFPGLIVDHAGLHP